MNPDSRVVYCVYFVLKEVLKIISVRFPYNLVIAFEQIRKTTDILVFPKWLSLNSVNHDKRTV